MANKKTYAHFHHFRYAQVSFLTRDEVSLPGYCQVWATFRNDQDAFSRPAARATLNARRETDYPSVVPNDYMRLFLRQLRDKEMTEELWATGNFGEAQSESRLFLYNEIVKHDTLQGLRTYIPKRWHRLLKRFANDV